MSGRLYLALVRENTDRLLRRGPASGLPTYAAYRAGRSQLWGEIPGQFELKHFHGRRLLQGQRTLWRHKEFFLTLPNSGQN